MVAVDFEEDIRKGLLGLFVVAHDFAEGVGDVVHDEVEVDVVALGRVKNTLSPWVK